MCDSSRCYYVHPSFFNLGVHIVSLYVKCQPCHFKSSLNLVNTYFDSELSSKVSSAGNSCLTSQTSEASVGASEQVVLFQGH